MSTRHLWFAVAVLLCLPPLARAQTTGAISGIVFDQNANPVEGATVKVSGEMLPAGRTVTTPATGQYAFPLLQPGVYTVQVSKQGVGDSTRQAVVEVDKNFTLDIVLGLAVKESVEVTAASPVIDTKSTEVDTNFKSQTLETLPLERSYRGLFQLIPGVAENRSTIGPAAGGSRQDNTYLLDGVNITNPGYGYLSSEVNELDIQEVNVKRAGVSAEFGRSAGVVTNAVTRSGTNRLSGTARIDYLPQSLIGSSQDVRFRDMLVQSVASPAVGIGGPIVKDKLFWYGSARYFQNTLWGRQDILSEPLPDQKTSGHELHAKITAAPTTNHLFNVAFRDRPNTVSNDGLSSGTAASAGYDTDNSSRMANVSWGYFLGNRSTIDVKYLYMKENNVNAPLTDLGYLPSFNAANLSAMGQYTDNARAGITTGGYQYAGIDNFRRHQVRGTFTRFLDLGKTNHDLHAGIGYEFGEENLLRTANGWGLLFPTTLSGKPVIRARYYAQQSPQLGQGTTWALFVQDNVTIASRLTVNAGLLTNRDSFAQNVPGSGGCPSTVWLKGGNAPYSSTGDTCTFLTFGFRDELQPRIGVTYNLRKDKGDKVYVNWGRYYNMDQKSSGRSLAPRRIFLTQTYFDYAGNVVSTGPLASTTGKLIDPSIQPTYNDEVLVGYATPFARLWSLDTFFMYRNTHNFIEDMPTKLPDSSPYGAANMPCSTPFSGTLAPGATALPWADCAGVVAKRSYKAFTIELARQLADKWSANISYTYSRFEGNFDLDYSGGAVYNTSSAIQDGPGTLVQDLFRYGPLRQDRPHVFKAFGSWLPLANVTLGAFLRVQSGTPWNARAPDLEGYVLNYLEPAGSHRNQTWTNLDLLAAYRLRLSQRANVTLEGRVLNVFGNQTQLSTDAQEFLDLNSLSAAPWIGPYKTVNPFYATANGYAPPRRLFLSVRADF